MVEFLPSINYSVVRSINSSKLPGLWSSSFQVGCGKYPTFLKAKKSILAQTMLKKKPIIKNPTVLTN